MKDPFLIDANAIPDRDLRGRETTRWVEGMLPRYGMEIDFFKPSLKFRRFRVAFALILCVLLLFFARSAQLQIIKGSNYAAASDTNRLRIVRLPAPRGAILERSGVALTRNVPRFEIVERSRTSVDPAVLETNLTLEDIYPLILERQNNPEVTVETISARQYPLGPAFSHLLGYLGKINEEEKESYRARGYSIASLVGRVGLEAGLEEILRGKDGRQHIEVDATGRTQNVMALENAVPGASVRLTIDAVLQERAHAALARGLKVAGSSRGAIIVLDPQDGGILALVSLPTFDNNMFASGPVAAETLRTIFTDPDRPLFNRAISGMYPSGSTIKPVIAAAALEEGLINRWTTIYSAGGIAVAQWFFPDWKAGGHGAVNVTRAIAESVNTFFYVIGGGDDRLHGLGIERIAQSLRKFGFGERSGVELPGEAAGLVPTPEWKEETKGERWYIGDTYHLSIGQGDILVTPLQIARMTAYFASDGKWTQPHLVMELPPSVISSEARNLTPSIGQGVGSLGYARDDVNHGLNIDPEHIQTVRQGMREAVLYGSARALQALPVASAGKTGTAQWASTKAPHAWFTGWAPYDAPEIVVTVLIEEGGEGSTAAIPVAREIMEWWLNRPR